MIKGGSRAAGAKEGRGGVVGRGRRGGGQWKKETGEGAGGEGRGLGMNDRLAHDTCFIPPSVIGMAWSSGTNS